MASHILSGAMEINEASQRDDVAKQPLRLDWIVCLISASLATFVLASISVSACCLHCGSSALWSLLKYCAIAKFVARAYAGDNSSENGLLKKKGWPIIVTGSAAAPAQTWGSQFFELRVIAHRNSA